MLIISGKICEMNLKKKADDPGKNWWYVKGDSVLCIIKPSPKTHSKNMHNTKTR